MNEPFRSKNCRVCGKPLDDPEPYVRDEFPEIAAIPVTVHNRCVKVLEQRQELKERIQWWEKHAPDEFLRTDEKHKGMPPKEVIDRIKMWHPSRRAGLLLQGPTGIGKTRCLFLLVRKIVVEHGVQVKWCLPGEIESLIESGYQANNYRGEIERLSSAPVLVIDDLGKDPITERMGSFLFNVVNNRTNRGLPMLITTNFNSYELEDRFTERNTGIPTVRRIMDFTEVLKVQPELIEI